MFRDGNGRSTILVVEDTNLIRKHITDLLNELVETPIVVAENGKVGLQKYEKNYDIALIITDIKMPVMSGHTMAGIIRTMEKYEERPHTPIYALTQYGDQDTIDKNSILNILPGLDKPVKESDLLKILNNFQYTRRQHDSK